MLSVENTTFMLDAVKTIVVTLIVVAPQIEGSLKAFFGLDCFPK